MRDLPNMGERERGKPDAPLPPITAMPVPSSAQPSPTSPLKSITAASPVSASGSASGGNNADPAATSASWMAAFGKVVWEKWRWGVLIALAVLVSRLSSDG